VLKSKVLSLIVLFILSIFINCDICLSQSINRDYVDFLAKKYVVDSSFDSNYNTYLSGIDIYRIPDKNNNEIKIWLIIVINDLAVRLNKVKSNKKYMEMIFNSYADDVNIVYKYYEISDKVDVLLVGDNYGNTIYEKKY